MEELEQKMKKRQIFECVIWILTSVTWDLEKSKEEYIFRLDFFLAYTLFLLDISSSYALLKLVLRNFILIKMTVSAFIVIETYL